jgi:hypothetical protein
MDYLTPDIQRRWFVWLFWDLADIQLKAVGFLEVWYTIVQLYYNFFLLK